MEHPDDPIVTVTFADGLGRVLQTKKDLERDTGTGTEVGMTVSGAVVFDALGSVVEQGQPVFSAEPDTTFTAVELVRSTRFERDVLSRTRLVEVPDPKATLTGGYAQTRVERDVVQFDGQLLFQETVIDANRLDAARAARDARAAELGPLRPPERPATVTGGYHTETGKPATGCSGGGKCTEDRVVEALGGDPSKVKFTEAVRPRPHGPPFREVDVCERCERKYGREPLPEGTKFESDKRR
ncbi:hypothetical protein [Sorangium sp. So ce233]|uniref:hypothetical protein n=1 Tax=Sorangium sp. So ce233 TaxID=3133290 RepID=UPI003F5DE40B